MRFTFISKYSSYSKNIADKIKFLIPSNLLKNNNAILIKMKKVCYTNIFF
jgi:hypothetical protein